MLHVANQSLLKSASFRFKDSCVLRSLLAASLNFLPNRHNFATMSGRQGKICVQSRFQCLDYFLFIYLWGPPHYFKGIENYNHLQKYIGIGRIQQSSDISESGEHVARIPVTSVFTLRQISEIIWRYEIFQICEKEQPGETSWPDLAVLFFDCLRTKRSLVARKPNYLW